ncbi:hypothetical protein OGAPHI_000835 [Ogataea philodendri]|uniref:Uncharacterized protein n=1 Tax=Ogataea philodendri TaxID=1378263 RepID=A0A9P8PGQ2_9ASCO|nr:uncharacterized protein OGAPHI_000835 [Ogataea philodendri]KAH3671124.1 hypothetical protein OGAPHI_000835 [Ogataea philodendri]
MNDWKYLSSVWLEILDSSSRSLSMTLSDWSFIALSSVTKKLQRKLVHNQCVVDVGVMGGGKVHEVGIERDGDFAQLSVGMRDRGQQNRQKFGHEHNERLGRNLQQRHEPLHRHELDQLLGRVHRCDEQVDDLGVVDHHVLAGDASRNEGRYEIRSRPGIESSSRSHETRNIRVYGLDAYMRSLSNGMNFAREKALGNCGSYTCSVLPFWSTTFAGGGSTGLARIEMYVAAFSLAMSLMSRSRISAAFFTLISTSATKRQSTSKISLKYTRISPLETLAML